MPRHKCDSSTDMPACILIKGTGHMNEVQLAGPKCPSQLAMLTIQVETLKHLEPWWKGWWNR